MRCRRLFSQQYHVAKEQAGPQGLAKNASICNPNRMTIAGKNEGFSLRELLHFYADAGVEFALDEEPLDRFAEGAAMAGQSEPAAESRDVSPVRREQSRSTANGEAQGKVVGVTARPATTAAIPDGAQVARARDLARQAQTLDELREQLAAFDGCNLKFTAKNLVFSDGNPEADLMLVGEAPGRDEDIQGLPFVGRSGQLLDRILKAIGRDRSSAYIANTVPWRPPGNRAPTPLETEICRPFIVRQIELAAPNVLVALGSPSAKLLLDTTEGIMRLRGNWRIHTTPSGTAIPVMPTLHPAYLLRNPAHKRLVWRDFLEVKAKLKELQG
jgi:DNA polymerase